MAINQIENARSITSRRTNRTTTRPRSGLQPELEAVVGVGLIIALGFLVPGQGWGLLNINPHPLWILVAAIAARYGRRPGYVVGILAGAAYSALILARSGMLPTQADPRLFVQPLLMLITGVALGELTDMRERRLANLETRSQSLETTLAQLWDRYRVLNLVKDTLQQRIAFGDRPVNHSKPVVKPPDELRVFDR